ncbi:MAG TPA: type I polyketide synthase, partial [Pseudonocardiaceae bacterium]|nr:type I polyketide synthase [Pseudonocardiaceae bacterium]
MVADNLILISVDRPTRTPLAEQLKDSGQVVGVISLLDEAVATLILLQALGDAGIDAPLWCVTQGAAAVDGTDTPPNPDEAAIWGLGRVAALEYPHRWGGLIDLPDHHALARVAGAITVAGGEDQIAIRPNGTWGRRLTQAPARAASPSAMSTRGTVLVTGGTGALGGHVARWLAREGAEHLLLVSRHGPAAPGADELAADLSDLGTRVSVIACDVADREALRAVIAAIPDEYPLTGVCHAAGIVADGVLDGLDAHDFESVFGAKVDGLRYLDELTRDRELQFFLAFSSIAGSLGGAGQGNYAAANAAVDGIIEARRRAGLPGLSVAWGAWAGDGMAADARASERARRGGLTPMDPARAMAALRESLLCGDTTVTVADINWQRLIPAFTAGRPSPLLSAIPGYTDSVDSLDRAGSLTGRLAALAVDERLPLVLEVVSAGVAKVLGHNSAGSVAADRAFRDAGFDSLTAVELSNHLAATTGVMLPSTAVFDHPSPRALAEFVVGELVGGSSGLVSVVSVGGVGVDPVVIVGMDCRFPGGVGSPDELWDLVVSGAEGLGGFPTDRGWDVDGLMDPAYAHVGGFVDGVAGFDAGFFG